ncbi:MAG: CAP domain-containing protein [Rhodovibrionaceae bacterium]
MFCFLAVPAQAAEPDFASELLAAINALRAQEGLQPLNRNAQLDGISQAHSDYMVRSDFIGHSGPDGRDLELRVEDTGYSYRLLAENIAAGPDDPDTVLAAWLNSPPHAHNLRLAEASEIGLGYSAGTLILEEGIASDVWTVVIAAPGSRPGEASGAPEASPQVVLILQPAYHPQQNLQPRGRAQGTP